jgi:hypothetical protein
LRGALGHLLVEQSAHLVLLPAGELARTERTVLELG